jgi:thiol-disulfide isomerase/thioredoxin
MRAKRRWVVVLLTAVTAAAGAPDKPAPVGVALGDAAPALTVKTWLKGEPLPGLAHDQVYVLGFWSSWSAPCRAMLPVLSQLQRAHPTATVVALDVWDREEAPAKAFVDGLDGQVECRVGIDDGEATAHAWLGEPGRVGLPSAYIVDGQGKLAWTGHPLLAGAILDRMAAGTWDLTAAHADAAREAAFEKEADAELAKVRDAHDDPAKQARLLRDWYGRNPMAEERYGHAILPALLRIARPAAAAQAMKLVHGALKDYAGGLLYVCWTILDFPSPQNTLEADLAAAAVAAARRADELAQHKDPSTLDALACAYHRQGDTSRAISLLKQALAMTKEPGLVKSLTQHLADCGSPAQPAVH